MAVTPISRVCGAESLLMKDGHGALPGQEHVVAFGSNTPIRTSRPARYFFLAGLWLSLHTAALPIRSERQAFFNTLISMMFRCCVKCGV